MSRQTHILLTRIFFCQDMVRELMRMRIGDEMREKQQAVVQAFGNTSRDRISIDVDKYLAESLKVHMIEAVGSRPLTDKQCEEWLDVNEDAVHKFSLMAAEVIGRARLLQMGKRLQEDAQYY